MITRITLRQQLDFVVICVITIKYIVYLSLCTSDEVDDQLITVTMIKAFSERAEYVCKCD